jgi:DNA-binding transcriptional LysR family regulator
VLVALDALLTERNVTRAGNRLNLGRSTMRGALARLVTTFTASCSYRSDAGWR